MIANTSPTTARLEASKRRPVWRGLLQAALLIAFSLQFTGCSFLQGINNFVAYNSSTDDFVIGWRDHVYSRRAYNLRRESLPVGQFESHFRAGFLAGYHNVAGGGNGCPPAMPPRHYWSWKYQTPEGQCKVDAWFQGYPHGARAAEEDGIGNYRSIQLSAQIEQGLKAHNYGKPPCYNCDPKPTPASGADGLYPDPEVMEPGIPAEETLPLGASDRSFGAESRSPIRPVNFEFERLPPTDAPRSGR